MQIPPELKDAWPGAVGALIFISRTKGPLLVRASQFIGGSSLSYFGAGPFTALMGLPGDSKGFAGFLLGLFGMAVVVKVFEAIDAVKADDLSRSLQDRISKRSGD